MNKSGFTLLEVIIVIALIAITMIFVVPTFSTRSTGITLFGKDLNTLMQAARLNALETGKTQKIYFNLRKNSIELQEETQEDRATGELKFALVKNKQFKASYTWPAYIEFRNFYIDTSQGIKDQMTRAIDDVWFFITSEAIAQAVVINLIDTRETGVKVKEAGFVLNPFTLKFEQHETFQKLS